MLALRVVFVVAVAACMVQGLPTSDKTDLLNQLRSLLGELDEQDAKVENVRSFSAIGSSMSSNTVAKRGIQTWTTETVYDASGSSRTIDVKADCLAAHNKVRALHQNTPDMEYDDDLAAGAQAWAEHIAGLGYLDHSTDSQRPGQGENLALTAVGSNAGTYMTTPAVAVFNWYAESWEDNYNYNVNAMQNAGHFTQVVWKGSTKVGCGVATVESGGMKKTYIVGRYSPPGNYGGQFTSNVMPLKPGATPPSRAADIEMGGCADYASKCSSFASYGFCSKLKSDCQCSCK